MHKIVKLEDSGNKAKVRTGKHHLLQVVVLLLLLATFMIQRHSAL